MNGWIKVTDEGAVLTSEDLEAFYVLAKQHRPTRPQPPYFVVSPREYEAWKTAIERRRSGGTGTDTTPPPPTGADGR